MENFKSNLKESSVENAEVNQEAISKISRVLEICEKKNEDIHILEEALTASPKALSELYDRVAKKYKTIIGALLFATVAHTSEAQELPTNSFTQQVAESTESIQTLQKKILNLKVGFDIENETQKVDREVTINIVENTASHTLVLLGQTHPVIKNQKVTYKLRDEIAQSQREIGSFLTATVTPTTRVFIEGHVSEHEEYDDTRREFFTLIQTSQNIGELHDAYNGISATCNSSQDMAILNKMTGDKLLAFGFEESAPMKYSNGEVTFVLNATGYFPEENSHTVPNDIESSMAGASVLLDASGHIDVLPAETVEGNKKPWEIIEHVKKKGEVLAELFVSFDSGNNFSQYLKNKDIPDLDKYSADQIEHMAQSEACVESPECQKIVAEILYEDMPALNKAVMDDREDIAVELIAKHAQTSNQTYFPLVYGNLHDFTRTVKRWNEKHPELQFNLVTVK